MDAGCPVCGSRASEGCISLRTGFVHRDRVEDAREPKPQATMVITREVEKTPEQEQQIALNMRAWSPPAFDVTEQGVVAR